MRDTCFICSRKSYDFEHHGLVSVFYNNDHIHCHILIWPAICMLCTPILIMCEVAVKTFISFFADFGF